MLLRSKRDVLPCKIIVLTWKRLEIVSPVRFIQAIKSIVWKMYLLSGTSLELWEGSCHIVNNILTKSTLVSFRKVSLINLIIFNACFVWPDCDKIFKILVSGLSVRHYNLRGHCLSLIGLHIINSWMNLLKKHCLWSRIL